MITVRKVERYTVYRESEKAELDPEKFKSLSVPFEGETELEFLEYIEENIGEFYDDEDLWNELDEQTQAEFGKLVEPEYEEYYNSAWDGEDSFFESGEDQGAGFVISETTNDR